MPFTIDPELIENDEVRLTENNDGNLEVVHVPTGSSLEIDTSGSVSDLIVTTWE
jgi:maltodextrin utilization protein YvdJ